MEFVFLLVGLSLFGLPLLLAWVCRKWSFHWLPPVLFSVALSNSQSLSSYIFHNSFSAVRCHAKDSLGNNMKACRLYEWRSPISVQVFSRKVEFMPQSVHRHFCFTYVLVCYNLPSSSRGVFSFLCLHVLHFTLLVSIWVLCRVVGYTKFDILEDVACASESIRMWLSKQFADVLVLYLHGRYFCLAFVVTHPEHVSYTIMRKFLISPLQKIMIRNIGLRRKHPSYVRFVFLLS